LTAKLSEPLRIGPVTFPNRVFLAPMSGVTDLPFRRIAARFGAGMVVTEMIAGGQLNHGHERTRLRAEAAPGLPHVVQLAGRDPAAMTIGARAAADAGADVIDINMGCPAKKVTNGLAGSALMRDLDHALRLIEATVAATDRPVTLKMRLGWDDRTRVAAELARRAEAAGVRMVTVHGRTRCQFYAGAADWTAVRAVKQSVAIPVVVNGDVTELADVEKALQRSGADAVMIGRGAQGRPGWPGTVANHARTGLPPKTPDRQDLLDLVLEHYEALLGHFGSELGIRVARKHLGWYIDRLPPDRLAADLRGRVMRETVPARVRDLLVAIFQPITEPLAA
jgi:nifR3 family TIM-barrel protein